MSTESNEPKRTTWGWFGPGAAVGLAIGAFIGVIALAFAGLLAVVGLVVGAGVGSLVGHYLGRCATALRRRIARPRASDVRPDGDRT